VLAPEHFLDLAGLDFLVELVERPAELGIDRLAEVRPLEEHAQIVAAFPQRPHQIAILFDAPPALQDFLRFGLIFPEFRGGGAGLEAGQFFIETGGFKDSSADRQRAC
jgi:hypothetical protein